jgi:hypothetical protein
MAPKFDPSLHTAPLQLFEDSFEPLISLGRNITIYYELGSPDQVTKLGKWITVQSVCGCETPEVFSQLLQTLIKQGIQQLYHILRRVSTNYWTPLLGHVHYRLEQMANIACIGDPVLPDQSASYLSGTKIRYFSSVIPVGPCNDDLPLITGYLRNRTVKFAELWFEAMHMAIDKLHLIEDLLKMSLAEDQDPVAIQPASSKGNLMKIKTDLTVPQLGLLFNLLVQSGQIIIPNRFVSALIRWIINNFSSKNQPSITFQSMRNNFITPDLMALDFWETLLQKWIDLIRRERIRLTQ